MGGWVSDEYVGGGGGAGDPHRESSLEKERCSSVFSVRLRVCACLSPSLAFLLCV